MQVEYCLLVTSENAVVLARAGAAPKYCLPLTQIPSTNLGQNLHIERSMEPEAIFCPVGSNRAAKTSPEWPVNSMTGDCSALVREPYSTCQRIATFSVGTRARKHPR
jgi:hypothetical protein